MLFLALLLVSDTAAPYYVPIAPAETIAVTIAGEGRPIVLIPGFFGSAFAFRNVTPALNEAGYRTLIVEPLGIGRSTRPRHSDYSLTAQAARIAAVLDSLSIYGAVVAAHSISGAIAYRLAIQRPDLVSAIVSIEGGPTESATTPAFRVAMKFAPILRIVGGRRMLRGLAVRNLRESSGDPSWITEETLRGYTQDAARDLGATLDAFRGMAEAREPWRLEDRLSEVAGPVYLLIGGAEHKGGVEDNELELLRSEIEALTQETVDGAGHFIFEEQPQAVIAAILHAAENPRPAALAGRPQP